MDEKLKRDLILEHYQNPFNRGLVDSDGYVKVNSRNSSCVDNIDIMAKVEDGIIIDMRFDGEACAICTSATSVMVKTLIGKTIEEAEEIIRNFENMINELPYDESVLSELVVYDTIYKQPSRKTCALLPFRGVKDIFKEEIK